MQAVAAWIVARIARESSVLLPAWNCTGGLRSRGIAEIGLDDGSLDTYGDSYGVVIIVIRTEYHELWGRDSIGQNTHERVESIAAVTSLAHDMSVLLGSTVATPYRLHLNR